jgi:16S rRNA C967 or C1407 C5-methylase (RsmB/RsmF family)
MTLPERFKERTAAILGSDEANKLFCAIESGEAVKAFRVNGIKTNETSFEASEPQIDRKKAEFPPDAYLTREEYPGSLPEHHSGAIYMQDISAMSTVWAAKPQKGARVLDSCSAPGGKTTQLAAAVGDEGIVVANEYERKRC